MIFVIIVDEKKKKRRKIFKSLDEIALLSFEFSSGRILFIVSRKLKLLKL